MVELSPARVMEIELAVVSWEVKNFSRTGRFRSVYGMIFPLLGVKEEDMPADLQREMQQRAKRQARFLTRALGCTEGELKAWARETFLQECEEAAEAMVTRGED